MTTDKKPAVLIVSDRAFYPVRRDGLAVRYYPLLEHLSSRYDFDLLIIGSEHETTKACQLRQLCRSIAVIPPPASHRFRFAQKLFFFARYLSPFSVPVAVHKYGSSGLANRIVEELQNKRYSCVLSAGGAYLQAVSLATERMQADRIVVDLIDSPSLIHQRRAPTDRGLLACRHKYEQRQLEKWESALSEKFDLVAYISEADSNAVPDYVRKTSRCVVVPNGVYVEDFSASGDEHAIPRCLGFVGNMAYPPNIEAVLWLYEKVFKPLRERVPDLQLLIVGRDPVAEVSALENAAGVTVTGTVTDIWKYISKIGISVLPIFQGGGLQNKVLESLFAGKPVITSSIGNEGIEAENGESILICDSAEEYIDAITSLVKDKQLMHRLSANGAAFVRNKFSWRPIAERFARVVLDGQE